MHPTLFTRVARSIPTIKVNASLSSPGPPLLLPELRNATWQFPTTRMARILSPKTPLKGRPLSIPDMRYRDSLNNYACIVDNLESALGTAYALMTATRWTRSTEKSHHYKPLAAFFNRCVQASHAGLDADPNFSIAKDHRRYADLSFEIKEHLQDQSKNPSSLLVGIPNLKVDNMMRWNFDEKPLYIFVEMGKEWIEIIDQAVIHARTLFHASPLRQFALVLGYDYVQRKLRFLVFHRGGLAASYALSVETDTKDILRLFMAILAWSSPADAGIPEWYNQTHIRIPRNCDDTEGVLAKVDGILHNRPCVRGNAKRAIRVSYAVDSPDSDIISSLLGLAPLHFVQQPLIQSSDLPKDPNDNEESDPMTLVLKSAWLRDDTVNIETRVLQTCSGQFGTPTHYHSYLACHKDRPITNHLFLPEDRKEAKEYNFKLLHKKVPFPEYRSLRMHTTSYVGDLLTTAKTPWDLFLALGHAMLGTFMSLNHKSRNRISGRLFRLVVDVSNGFSAQGHQYQ